MLTEIHPKLPMRNKNETKEYYIQKLGFTELSDYGDYLLVRKDKVEIHFFEFTELDPANNYGQVYIRTNDIEQLYQNVIDAGLQIHPAGHLQIKPWGQREFSMLDPDNNLLTFGQPL